MRAAYYERNGAAREVLRVAVFVECFNNSMLRT